LSREALAGTLGLVLRWLVIIGLSLAVVACREGLRVRRARLARRRQADLWLQTADGFIPPEYRWRADELCSARERRTIARSLRGIIATAKSRRLVIAGAFDRDAVVRHAAAIDDLASRLLDTARPVTPAGMLLANDLLTSPWSALWSDARSDLLPNAIRRTLAALEPPPQRWVSNHP
jgi:hypothetical protein